MRRLKIISAQQFRDEYERVNTNTNDEELNRTVLDVIEQVKEKGDVALRELTEKFDRVKLDQFLVTEEEINQAKESVSPQFIEAIQTAKKNIQAFHENQVEKSWFIEGKQGEILGQKVTPLDSVGVYVPGGTAAYPSTVLMNVVPATIAGVKNIVMTTPPQEDGRVNPYILVAAAEAGIDQIYKVGGAQAIAALAYGTKTIPKVAKIVGPGNAYVACAKKWVFGDVDIDMIAGPSEICVVADETAKPSYVALDLLSQAEHDELATAICITTSETFAERLQQEINTQVGKLERKAIIEVSLANNGRIIVVDSLREAFDIVNDLAPEHLQIMIENPMEAVSSVKHAGAIFLGNYSPEALGDYVAGPNHTLPTNGTAVFSSPLGVYDFIKRSSIIYYPEAALQTVANDITTIAYAEGLTAHAKSIEKRMEE